MEDPPADGELDPVASLRGLYVANLREVAASSRARVAALRAAGTSAAAAAALRGLAVDFHGLNGSGATFGFPRVSEIGAAAEAVLRALREDGDAPARRESLAAALALALDDLDAIAARAEANEPDPPAAPASLASLLSLQLP